MTPNEYQVRALLTEKTPPFVDEATANSQLQADGSCVDLSRLMHAQLGVGSEFGELCDAIKKQVIYGKVIDRTNIIEEFGDVLWYVALGLAACGSNIEEAMVRNIAKLEKRYPQGFTQHAALNRNLPGERKVLEAGKLHCADCMKQLCECDDRGCGKARNL